MPSVAPGALSAAQIDQHLAIGERAVRPHVVAPRPAVRKHFLSCQRAVAGDPFPSASATPRGIRQALYGAWAAQDQVRREQILNREPQ